VSAPNPLSLISMGIGTLGSLAGGISDAIEAPKRKRRFLEDAKRQAQITALRNSRWTDFFPTNALDAKHKQYDVQRQADENFNVDPMSLVPFVGNATALAGGIYDYANAPKEPFKAANPEQLQFFQDWRPNQAPAHMTPANPEPYRKKWWE
jgi:hypothetical protein